ncbi:MAG: hypothetical protein Q4E43_08570, partial [Akkermansia sp.]|nr:hypothetical protein [Akkermansia sp.]
WSLGPPLPFRAAPDKGRGQMIHERICNVKLNLQIFWIFFAESLGTRMGSGIAGWDFFCGWAEKLETTTLFHPHRERLMISDLGFGICLHKTGGVPEHARP